MCCMPTSYRPIRARTEEQQNLGNLLFEIHFLSYWIHNFRTRSNQLLKIFATKFRTKCLTNARNSLINTLKPSWIWLILCLRSKFVKNCNCAPKSIWQVSSYWKLYVEFDLQFSVFLDEILECGVCQGVSVFLSSHKDSELSVDQIKDLSCETFPSKYFKKCTELVDYYSISIKNLIKDGLTEDQICTKIGKCSDNEGKHAFGMVVNDHKTKRTLVGDNECTYGPSHWCSSEDVAKKCDVSLLYFSWRVSSNLFFLVFSWWNTVRKFGKQRKLRKSCDTCL